MPSENSITLRSKKHAENGLSSPIYGPPFQCNEVTIPDHRLLSTGCETFGRHCHCGWTFLGFDVRVILYVMVFIQLFKYTCTRFWGIGSPGDGDQIWRPKASVAIKKRKATTSISRVQEGSYGVRSLPAKSSDVSAAMTRRFRTTSTGMR